MFEKFINSQTITGTSKVDFIYNTGKDVTINAGDGSIFNGGDKVTINADKGNDTIETRGKNVEFFYAPGDGKDVINQSSDRIFLRGHG